MQNLAHRLTSILFLSFIAVTVTGIMDGLIAMASFSGSDLAVFVTVCSITMSVLLLAALPAALIIGVQFDNSDDLPGMPGRIFRLLHPPSLPARKAGALLAAEVVCFIAAFVAVVALVDYAFADSMETTAYAAVSTALVAAVVALALVRLSLRLKRNQERCFEKASAGRRDVRPTRLSAIADDLLSPWGVLVVAGLIGTGILLPRLKTVFLIMNALPLGPAGMVFAGIASGIVLGIIFDFRHVPRAWKIAVFSTVPAISAALMALTVSGVLIDDEVRIAFKADGTVSAIGYDVILGALDYDDDGLLDIMNDGDCAPRDQLISASAIEIAENGIDENCNGKDLVWNEDDNHFQGRWDYPVAAEIQGHRYNVLLVTIDAAAPDRMSLYGHRRPTTPNLERIAGAAALFKSAYSSGPSTRLSIPAIMTSKYGPQLDIVTGRRVPVEEFPANRLMSEILRRSGYRTYAVTSTLFFSNWKDILRGFDHVENMPAAYDSEHHQNHSGAQVTATTLSLLQKASTELQQPFFMWIHYYDLHQPYTPVPGGTSWGNTDADIYDSEMDYLDGQVGRLVSGLDKLFDPKETILIILADHGETFDEYHAGKAHGMDLHTTAVHIPLIVRAPFVKPGVYEGPVSAIDILPTLVNVLGIKGDYRFRGTSLVPQIVGGFDDVNRNVLSVFYQPEDIIQNMPIRAASVRTGSTSYIWDLETNTREVYDFIHDPYETRNLTGVYPRKVLEMRNLMSKWLAWLESMNREGLPSD